MPSTTRIICLANSWKHGERCIAGININTGEWVRPISRCFPKNGRIPEKIRLIDGCEPELLEILEIPLEENGDNFDFASENRWIAQGKWSRLNKVQPSDIILYCSYYSYILHNSHKYVTVSFLKNLPQKERRTLQLVYARELSVLKSTNWKATIKTSNGQLLQDISITDPEFVKRLDIGYQPQSACLVTMSLSMPHRPNNWQGDDPCWKLITGVIELTKANQILAEMHRLRWTIDRGREYLVSLYGKHSRHLLSDPELTAFLDYLKSLPN